MSQRCVEKVIGRLVTDEAFRRRFFAAPEALLQELAAHGVELNPCERRALLSIELSWVERFADALDPRIQKVELFGGK